MNTDILKKRDRLVKILIGISILLLGAIYFLPAWWVALLAPQYPVEAFPDGVKINFHFNGVFNGCELLGKAEIEENVALDCVHEMDAINHFVGMYPIASGGVVEKFFSPFLLSMMAVMLAGFATIKTKLRMIILGVGFTAIGAWMALAFYSPGGVKYQSKSYLSAMVTSMGQGEEETGDPISSIISSLKAELERGGGSSYTSRAELDSNLEKSGQSNLKNIINELHSGSGEDAEGDKQRLLKDILAEAKRTAKPGKARDIAILKGAFEADQNRKPIAEREVWTGAGNQLVFWNYDKALGRWFNNPEEIGPLVKTMKTFGMLMFFGVLVAMLGLIALTRKTGSIFYYLLIVGPLMLPFFFIIEYAGWLWWYGHSMNEMGAFTLKPFMPTVIGQGKVAQFKTNSYPSIGFGLMMVMSAMLALSLLLRRKNLKES